MYVAALEICQSQQLYLFSAIKKPKLETVYGVVNFKTAAS